jgi:hypothetical protein
MKWAFGALFLCGSIVLAAPLPSPATAPAPPLADAKVPFRAGEALTYDASWSNFLTAGRVTLRVAERRALSGGRAAYNLIAEAQSVSLAASLYQVYYKVDSLLETSTLSPIESSTYSSERGRVKVKTIKFGPNNTGNVNVKTATDFNTKVQLPPHTLDVLSAMYVLRALVVKPGETITIPVVEADNVSRLRLTFGAREMVKTGMGTLPGWKVTPMLLDDRGRPTTTRKLTFWLSDDAARRPIRFEASLAVGTITLTLAKVGG